MNRNFLKIGTAALAALLLLSALSASALADGDPSAAGSLTVLKVKDENDDKDKAEYYTIPAGLPDDAEPLKLYVPVQCTGSVEKVACTAEKIDTDILETPASLVATAIGGDTTPIASLSDTQKAYFVFTLKIAEKAQAGSYTLPVQLTYQVGGVDAAPLKAAIKYRVKFPAATPTPAAAVEEVVVYDSGSSSSSSGSSSGYKSKPKVIVSGYSFDTDKLYAGEPATLSLRLRNTSTREAVRNLELKFSNEAGVIVPVSGGSTSIFVGEIKKDSAATVQIPLEIAPDAEAKAQTIALEIIYEGTRNKQEFTDKSSITAQVYQRARVRTDQPVVYDEAWVGQTVSMSVQMFNMGKSTLYNCMAEVRGEGLSLEETYYGGNVAPGSTMRADLTLKTDVAGTISGEMDILYEDVFGEQSVETLPFTVVVNEEPAPMSEEELAAMAGAETNAGAGGGILRFWWIGAIVLAAALLVLATVLLKRRRARQLSDELAEEAAFAAQEPEENASAEQDGE